MKPVRRGERLHRSKHLEAILPNVNCVDKQEFKFRNGTFSTAFQQRFKFVFIGRALRARNLVKKDYFNLLCQPLFLFTVPTV